MMEPTFVKDNMMACLDKSSVEITILDVGICGGIPDEDTQTTNAEIVEVRLPAIPVLIWGCHMTVVNMMVMEVCSVV